MLSPLTLFDSVVGDSLRSLTVMQSFVVCLMVCKPAGAQSVEYLAAHEAYRPAQAAAVSISARLVDPTLPDTPFLVWLQGVIEKEALSEISPGASRVCQHIPTETGFPTDLTTPWNFCAGVIAWLKDGRELNVALDASVIRDAARPGEWKPVSARFSAAYVVDGRRGPRGWDSLDVPNLGALESALQIPIARWPHAELRIAAEDIRVEPTSFRTGDRLVVAVTVHNVGTTSGRVRLNLASFAECSDVGFGLAEIEGGDIPPGQAITLRAEIAAPKLPRWWLHASAQLRHVNNTIRKYEMTPTLKVAAKAIGPGPFGNCTAG